MSDKYFVLHTSPTTIVFPHQLYNTGVDTPEHIDLLHINKKEFISDIIQSYNDNSKKIWNAYIVDGRRMKFSIKKNPASLLDTTEYIIGNTNPKKRKIIAALCTQSVFGYIYEQLQNCLDERKVSEAQQRIVCEIGKSMHDSRMHATLNISKALISLSIHKKLRILEILPRGFNQTLEILDITVDIKVENFETPNAPPVPSEICVKIDYE